MKSNSLDILKKQGSGFKIPKGYFKTVEEDVYAKLKIEKLPSKEGFNTPIDYFETIESAVLQHLNKNTQAEKVSFDIPKNYFETIEDRVFDKIKTEKLKQPKIINLKALVIKIIVPVAAAASLLLMFVLNYNNKTSYTIDDVASTEVENWIDEGYITLDSHQIAEVFNDVELTMESNTEDEELINYLNGTDIESILNN